MCPSSRLSVSCTLHTRLAIANEEVFSPPQLRKGLCKGGAGAGGVERAAEFAMCMCFRPTGPSRESSRSRELPAGCHFCIGAFIYDVRSGWGEGVPKKAEERNKIS